MKALTTVAMYGLVPVPPIQDAQALGKNDDQPPMAEDSNAALLAWYRHLATSDEIALAQGDSPLSMSGVRLAGLAAVIGTVASRREDV
jgi:hypothetical protein